VIKSISNSLCDTLTVR